MFSCFFYTLEYVAFCFCFSHLKFALHSPICNRYGSYLYLALSYMPQVGFPRFLMFLEVMFVHVLLEILFWLLDLPFSTSIFFALLVLEKGFEYLVGT